VEIRQYSEADSADALTLLIRKAYKQLAELGFRYWATHQSVADTRTRMARGECYVAVRAGCVVGTIVLNGPERRGEVPWYDRPEVATFHQFAVEPELQRQGVGSALLAHAEERAAALGARELACDTATGAEHLIQFYARRQFREVGTADWEMTNYESVILSKRLDGEEVL
jgi:GNAT superfamily N-acetyltransferase